MEFSEEISPIFDSKLKVSRDLAYPIIKYSIEAVFISIDAYIHRREQKFLQI